jgi:hypothetical protein
LCCYRVDNVKHLKIMMFIKFAILEAKDKVDYCVWIHYADNSVGISNHATLEEAEGFVEDEMKNFDVYESKITPRNWS